MSESVAVFCCGAFFGAALYINLVQQPAALALGPAFAARYFAPMYRRAAPLQVTLAFVGTVVSESVASNNGIGNLMLQAQAQFNVPLIFAGLLALAVLGIVMYWVMAVLELRMTGWAQRSGFAQN